MKERREINTLMYQTSSKQISRFIFDLWRRRDLCRRLQRQRKV